jgi:hypothetical protein
VAGSKKLQEVTAEEEAESFHGREHEASWCSSRPGEAGLSSPQDAKKIETEKEQKERKEIKK